MFCDISFATILFRFTVFSLLLLKLLQLSKEFLIPYLFSEVKREKTIRTELIGKENYVKSTQNKIENQIKVQNKLFFDLEKNVQKWHANLKIERDETETRLLNIKNKIERKRDIQRANYILTSTYNTAIPIAVDLAQKQLETFYSTEEGCTQFNKLIKTL